MMIKRFKYLLIVLAVMVGDHVSAQCKAKQMMQSCKPNLGKYTYDAYVVHEIIIDDKPHMVESQFTAFGGEKYKVIFCSYNLGDNDVTLNIYDKNSKVKNRKKLYDNSSGIDNLFWSFEPTKSGSYYIEYTVPPAKDGKPKKACVVMLIGYIEEE